MLDLLPGQPSKAVVQKRKYEVMDCVLVPPPPYNPRVRAISQGEYGRGSDGSRSGTRSRSRKTKSTRPEAVPSSSEDVLNEAWARNDRAGTIPVGAGEWLTPSPNHDPMKLTPRRRRDPTQSNHPGELPAPSPPPTASSIGLVSTPQRRTVFPKNITDSSTSSFNLRSYQRRQVLSLQRPAVAQGCRRRAALPPVPGEVGRDVHDVYGVDHAYCVRYEPETVPFVLLRLRRSVSNARTVVPATNAQKPARPQRSAPRRSIWSRALPGLRGPRASRHPGARVYYATMYDCRTCVPVAEIFVGADGGDVVQARPLANRRVPDAASTAAPISVAPLPTDVHANAENLDAVLGIALAGPNVANAISYSVEPLGILSVGAMPLLEPPFAHTVSPNAGLDSHAIPGGTSPRPTTSDTPNCTPLMPPSSLYSLSIPHQQTPLSYDDFFASIRRPTHMTAGAGRLIVSWETKLSDNFVVRLIATRDKANLD
ncbi:hypothetical protein B0H13DRAFT_2293856 [Mycena leptocephala]|nr:hypothetical protein B0H13DRAFT_2293856 [Mycena leptocephala]